MAMSTDWALKLSPQYQGIAEGWMLFSVILFEGNEAPYVAQIASQYVI